MGCSADMCLFDCLFRQRMTASHDNHCPTSQIKWPNTAKISHLQEFGWHLVSPKEVTHNKRQNGPIARKTATRLYAKCFAVPEVELGLVEVAVLVVPGGGVSF